MPWLSPLLDSFSAFSALAWAGLVATAFGGALLTFFSGFGLGTILLPIFTLFFPPAAAVAATAVVHLSANGLKLGLLRRSISLEVFGPFALTAVPAALAGAAALGWLAAQPAVVTWSSGAASHGVTPLRIVLGGLMAAFALVELVPAGRLPALSRRMLPLGGLLSGFFGGLTGHQGALRSMFLVKAGLAPEAYIATGVAIAVLVDLTRLAVYGAWPGSLALTATPGPLLVGMGAAFAGVWVGRRCLHTVTIVGLQRGVAGALLVYGAALAAGLI